MAAFFSPLQLLFFSSILVALLAVYRRAVIETLLLHLE